MLTTWRKLITDEMEMRGETFDDIVSIAIKKGGLDVKFYAGFGAPEGCGFTIWTETRVYFPTAYDGAEGCESVPRHPNGVAGGHVGG